MIMNNECYKIIKDGKPLNNKDYSTIKEQIKLFEQGLKKHKKMRSIIKISLIGNMTI